MIICMWTMNDNAIIYSRNVFRMEMKLGVFIVLIRRITLIGAGIIKSPLSRTFTTCNTTSCSKSSREKLVFYHFPFVLSSKSQTAKFCLNRNQLIRIAKRYLAVSCSNRMGVADDVTGKGEFVRKDSQFRNFIRKDGEFPPEKDRYHLYISLACPWAHRTLIVRKLKGLENVIGLSVVHYLMLENGWEFADPSVDPGCIPDTVNNFKLLKEIYFQCDPNYKGRYTVPILYDTKTKKIVNNESSEIVRMFNSEFNEFSTTPELDLYPEGFRGQIDQWNDIIYNGLNNGVYKAGFALSQEAYEPNARLVADTMLKVENLLGDSRGPFLFGEGLTETDIRLFTSIIRHDPVYYFHFKCNLVAVKDLPKLSKWLQVVYEHGGIKETVNMDHIKKHYFMSHRHINPTGVVPLYNGPIIGN